MNYLPVNLTQFGLVSDNARPHLRETKSAEDLIPCSSLSSIPELCRSNSFGNDDIMRRPRRKSRNKLAKSIRCRSKSKTWENSKGSCDNISSRSRWDNCTPAEAPKPESEPQDRKLNTSPKIQQTKRPADLSPKRPSRLVREESMMFCIEKTLEENNECNKLRSNTQNLRFEDASKNRISNEKNSPRRPSRLVREESLIYFESSYSGSCKGESGQVDMESNSTAKSIPPKFKLNSASSAPRRPSRLFREESLKHFENSFTDSWRLNVDDDCSPTSVIPESPLDSSMDFDNIQYPSRKTGQDSNAFVLDAQQSSCMSNITLDDFHYSA